jgi:hypothetical protein
MVPATWSPWSPWLGPLRLAVIRPLKSTWGDHYAGAAVVASAGEWHADRRRSVVFGSGEVFGLARSLFRLYKLHFGKRGNALQVTRVDPNTDSVGCGRDDRADAVEVR